MALLGKGALAMFWDLAPEIRTEFEDWHSHEHFRERLAIPGFRRATRWSSATGSEAMFQLYELETYDTLSSAPYLARLNDPTPWSSKMMPHHRNMVRCQCRVLESGGGYVARCILTLRLSPAEGKGQALRAALKEVIAGLVDRPGFAGAHLLRHEAPPIAVTTEQKLRGADRAADWIFVASAYDERVVEALVGADLSATALAGMGAAPGVVAGLYTLSYSVAAAEMD